MSSAESAAAKVNKISEQVALKLEQLEFNLKEFGGKKDIDANDEKKYFVYDVRYCMPCPALLYLCHSHEISRLLHC